MTDRSPFAASAPWQPWSPTPPPPRRPRGPLKGGDALVLVLAVIIGVLLVSGGVGVAVVSSSDHPSALPSVEPGSGRPGRGGTPGSSSTVPPSTSTITPGSVTPVTPATDPAVKGAPVTVPPVTAHPSSLSPSMISGLVDPAVVDVDTRLGYQNAIAAGTGMILSSNGLVLTNNHVINGATTIGAVSLATGRSYTARVVGVDPTADVAVIQLVGAAGLPIVSTSAAGANAGDPVVAIGNAGGLGGSPSVTSGNVVALDQSIIASDPAEGSSEQLNGLIETSASLQPGDSGGPLVNGQGGVIGMDTAASASGQSITTVSFAIPISQALAVAQQIEAGDASDTIHLGLPAFLGVGVTAGSGAGGRFGVLVTSVVAGGPAAAVGVGPGALILAVNGAAVDSPSALTSVLLQYRPGQAVTLTWIGTSGATHNARVVLGTGPAD